ncbi:MAG: glycosyltransferase family 2 protein [Planctomycetes bacterium]|nr:glycosyltransferase family 2 protein [Planctomycetota bacterium]
MDGTETRQPLRPSAPASTGAAVPRLSIIVVNYRQWENTAALAGQVLSSQAAARGDVEIMVVDNHSPPHRLLPQLRRTEGVSLRRWGRNHGFARAVNEGVRLSRGSWLLLLNPDMSVTPGFIEGVIGHADRLAASAPRAGIVGFQVRDGDNGLQPSVGRFPTLLRCLVGLIMPRCRRRCQVVASRRRRQVDWVSGCCLLIRKECFDDVGGLDKHFFLYYEDVDLCRRARDRGWTVWHEPTLRVVHHEPLHRRRVPPMLRLVVRHSLLTYAARHWPRWQLRVLGAIVRLEAWLRWLLGHCRRNRHAGGVAGEQAALAGEMARGNFRAARRRLSRAIRRQERTGGLAAHYNTHHHELEPRLQLGARCTSGREAPQSPRTGIPQPDDAACLASIDG